MFCPRPLHSQPARTVLAGLLLALLVTQGGGCHLIFPFSTTAAEPDADQTPLDGGTDVLDLSAQDLPAQDLSAQDLPADQDVPQDLKVDAPPCACSAADLDNSGKVDSLDLNQFGTCFGKPPTGTCKVADTDSDGDVDGTDLNCINFWYKQSCS